MHYISSDGYDMYVGKNNLQNEELTFLLPMAMTGGSMQKVLRSHVIVKSGGDELPDRTFEEAGRLAATTLKPWSRQSGDRLYPEKTCQEAERGKAGFVVYYTNYSLVIDSDISNIKNVQD